MSRNPKWLKELKALSKQNMLPTDIEPILEAIAHDPSDRGTALSVASLVETALFQFIRSWVVRPANKDEENLLFGGDAPLGNFSSRIRVAYAFGLIDESVRNNLNTIREIRNAFAHTVRPINFETQEVAVACEQLSLGENLPFMLTDAPSIGRGSYIMMCGFLMHALVGGALRSEGSRPSLPVSFSATIQILRQPQPNTSTCPR